MKRLVAAEILMRIAMAKTAKEQLDSLERDMTAVIAEERESIAAELGAVPGQIYADVAAKMIREGRIGRGTR